MKRWFLIIVMLLLGGEACAQAATPQAIAITHVNVIDGRSPATRADQTVIVLGDRIVAAGPAASTTVPAGARVIDGRNKYLVPGFWDMHVHTDAPGGRETLPLYVANGVLGVRDLAADWNKIAQLRREIAAGQLIGPRIIAAGPYLEGGAVPIPHLLARTPAEAAAAVDSLARLGVDVVKLHSQLSREVYFAALRAARRHQLPTAGHVPRTVTAQEASDSGLQSLEHLLQIPLPCTPAESLALEPRFPLQGMVGRCTSNSLTPLFATLVRNKTAVVPTLIAGYEIAHWPKRDLPGDAYAAYLPDTLRRFVAAIFPMPDGVPANAEVVGHAIWQKRIEEVGIMHRAGVTILAGTDAPLRTSPPGFGLHEELAILSRAGISNYDVLRIATYEPARFLGLLNSAGTVEPGRRADLVLLAAHPLADIRNTRRIETVLANGRLFDAAALAALRPHR